MIKGSQYLLFFIFFAIMVPLSSKIHADDLDPTVSVKLTNYLDRPTEISLSIHGTYQMTEDPLFSFMSDTNYRLSIANGHLVLSTGDIPLKTLGTSFSIKPITYSTDDYITLNHRPYLGEMTFTLENDGTISSINKLPLDDYLKGVVPCEMSSLWNLEALKTQAVAARTYALSKAGKIIGDTTRYQVYGGFSWSPTSSKAVDETKGQVLTYNGKLIDAVYSADNGGIIESSEDAWNSPVPYLSVKKDPYDPINPWRANLNKVQIDLNGKDLMHPEIWWDSSQEQDPGIADGLKNWLRYHGYSNTEIKITSIPLLQISDDRTAGGRATKGSISIQFLVKDAQGIRMGDDGNIQTMSVDYHGVPISQLEKMMGKKVLKSNLIDSAQDDGTSYTIVGRGFGHGVGMSQWGAKMMGENGFSYQQILAFYYPGSHLNGVHPSALFVTGSTDSLTTNSTIRININGKFLNADQSPVIENNRVLVPLRGIFEALGADVKWDNITNSIIALKGSTKIKLHLDSKKAMVNDQIVWLDVAPKLENNRTVVPVRFIGEALGANVKWDETNQTVMINTNF